MHITNCYSKHMNFSVNVVVAKKKIDIWGMKTKLRQHAKVCPSCDNREWAIVAFWYIYNYPSNWNVHNKF